MNGSRKIKKDTNGTGCNGAHYKLPLCPDIEDAGPEGKGHAQSCEDQRRCVHNAPGNVFHLAENTV